MKKSNTPKYITVHGTVSSGIGKSKLFTEIPWVRKQFKEKLKVNPYPGTLNVIVMPEDRNKLTTIKNIKGVEIIPEDKHFCAAKGFTALVNGRIKGAIIIPLVPDYPKYQLEIISPKHIKQSLSLKDGDIVEVIISL